MTVQDLNEFIQENMVVLIAVLYVLGMLLKNTPRVPDWTIPWALLVIGVTLAIVVGGLCADSIIQGVLVTGATVLINQLIKQTTVQG